MTRVYRFNVPPHNLVPASTLIVPLSSFYRPLSFILNLNLTLSAYVSFTYLSDKVFCPLSADPSLTLLPVATISPLQNPLRRETPANKPFNKTTVKKVKDLDNTADFTGKSKTCTAGAPNSTRALMIFFFCCGEIVMVYPFALSSSVFILAFA